MLFFLLSLNMKLEGQVALETDYLSSANPHLMADLFSVHLSLPEVMHVSFRLHLSHLLLRYHPLLSLDHKRLECLKVVLRGFGEQGRTSRNPSCGSVGGLRGTPSV